MLAYVGVGVPVDPVTPESFDFKFEFSSRFTPRKYLLY